MNIMPLKPQFGTIYVRTKRPEYTEMGAITDMHIIIRQTRNTTNGGFTVVRAAQFYRHDPEASGYDYNAVLGRDPYLNIIDSTIPDPSAREQEELKIASALRQSIGRDFTIGFEVSQVGESQSS